jgi:hypothetical protein
LTGSRSLNNEISRPDCDTDEHIERGFINPTRSFLLKFVQIAE